MVGEGFEPSKLSRQIYSLIPLTARESHLREAAHSYLMRPPCQQPAEATAQFTYNLRLSMVPAVGLELTTY